MSDSLKQTLAIIEASLQQFRSYLEHLEQIEGKWTPFLPEGSKRTVDAYVALLLEHPEFKDSFLAYSNTGLDLSGIATSIRALATELENKTDYHATREMVLDAVTKYSYSRAEKQQVETAS